MSSRKLLAWTQRFAALALVAFWISFWADHRDLPPNVVDIEWSFLIPDIAWIAAAFCIASHWLIARDPRAAIATAVAGGSLSILDYSMWSRTFATTNTAIRFPGVP